MERAEFAGDAIEFDDDGYVFSRYGEYILKPAYQPIYNVNKNGTATLEGYEALLRPHFNGSSISPDDFFRAINDEDKLYVECLCILLHIRGYEFSCKEKVALFLNVNVANYGSIELIEREFFYTFSQLAKYGLKRDKIVFEILETEVTNPEILLRLCDLFKNNGYRFALDDFGTRHSNVERYLSVSPSIIKLDRSLFVSAMQSKETGNLLGSLIRVFQEHGVSVLMEGVETPEEMYFSEEMKVDMLQGFYLGRPNSQIQDFLKEITLPKREKLEISEQVA